MTRLKLSWDADSRGNDWSLVKMIRHHLGSGNDQV